MRNSVIAGLVVLALASLVGCASPQSTVKVPDAHVTVAMDDATARALLADDDLVPVGITTLTGADFYVTVPAQKPVVAAEPAAPALRTWGVDPTDEPGIPSTRE